MAVSTDALRHDLGGTRALAGRAPLRASAGRMLMLPFLLAMCLAAFAMLDSVRQNRALLTAIMGSATTLALWNAVLLAVARRTGRVLTLEVVARRQHYLQACAQGAVLLYWGWYWRPVYDAAHLIALQVVFAYAFDMLLGWSRRDTYTLGFGVFPVIFSINLFLWFKPDWFYFQFLMVAFGFAAKELIRWEKEGRLSHIFNPSSFPLAVFSLALLLSGQSDMTWGQEIAITQFYPPQIYLMLFLVGLPGQYFFGVTTMTLSAVVATYAWGLLYYAVTGVYFFYDSFIPIAVFLGMHLLFTDPSTSPRTELGRIVFGVLYGLSTVALYALLGRAGLPTFYDKLLQVPLLNVSIQLIDRAARSKRLRAFDPASLGRSLDGRRRHLAYMSVWAVVFAAISGAGGLGDDHPGQWLPFWQKGCGEGRPSACSYLKVMQANFCNQGSGWACNELGILRARLDADLPGAIEPLQRGCALGFASACANLTNPAELTRDGHVFETSAPTIEDFPIILRGSKGPIDGKSEAALLALACRQGWPATCGRAN
jgi:hypothetical protein